MHPTNRLSLKSAECEAAALLLAAAKQQTHFRATYVSLRLLLSRPLGQRGEAVDTGCHFSGFHVVVLLVTFRSGGKAASSSTVQMFILLLVKLSEK